MTAVTFDVRDLAPVDRAEALRAAVGPSVLWVDVDHHAADRTIAARGTIRRVGRLTQFSVRTTPMTIRRTPRHTRDGSETRLILAVQRSGTATVVQNDRQAVVHAGDMVLVDSSQPFTAVNKDGTHHHYFCVPRARLALPDRMLGEITATRLGPDNPVAALAATHMSRLARSRALAESPGAHAVDRAAVELVRAMIATQLGAADRAREPLENTLALRIMEHVRRRIDDPALSAAGIAGEFGISVRHLYGVLARAGIELGEWIRTRRLEACRADLSDPRGSRLTIASVARGHGFTDVSHFGRLFKDAYGMPPGEWRARSLPADGPRD
ncbi:helix-turn-helix domain-containing protein [Streptomyces sp. NPDC048297]|uniref:helix-turn-helix domain-containing protein n=1 Tax=Streptomyces sp. NPDC048297 TaxID=3365531 RepID=UPI0037145A70